MSFRGFRHVLSKYPSASTLSRSRRRFFFSLKSFWPTASDFEIYPVNLLSIENTNTGSSPFTWAAVSDKEYRGESVCEVNLSAKGLHFHGEVRTPPAIIDEVEVKRGFCAVKGKIPRGGECIDLRDHCGLDVRLSSRYRASFTFNMTCRSFFKYDLYQLDVTLPPCSNMLLHLPFPAFRLTARGVERAMQRANDDLQCEGLGMLVTTVRGTVYCLG